MRHGIRRRSQLPKSLLLRAKVLIEFAAVHMSLIGTKCACRVAPVMAALR
jgi:hypothetical protein